MRNFQCIVSAPGSACYPLSLTGVSHPSDAHDAVLRFNAAPTEGYERDVGNKTTIRIINSQVRENLPFEPSKANTSVQRRIVWAPFHRKGDEYLL